MYIRIDGGNASSSALINAVGRIVQILSDQSSAMSELDANSGVPVEIYYRPPISYYDDFQLSQMDNNTLFYLERRLIE